MDNNEKIIFVDVDDTFVRSVGTTRIRIPTVLKALEKLHQAGAVLYCWSSGGAAYAKRSAEEFDVDHLFVGFLPKPHVMLDDVAPEDWRRLTHVHPNNVRSLIE